MSQNCIAQERKITQLKPDVLTQTELLSQLMFPNHQVSWHNLLIFLVFMLLFLAIDMLAVVLKISSAGIYESKLGLIEAHYKLTDYVNQRQSSVAEFSAMAMRQTATIENTANKPLKQNLEENFQRLMHDYIHQDRQHLEAFFRD